MSASSSDRTLRRRAEWRWGVGVALLAAALILPGLGIREFLTADEGYRAYPPIEMLETGDWVVPRMNGEEYMKKPPLLYWEVALVYKTLGVSEWTARLPVAFTGIALIVVVYLFARRSSRDSIAALAAVITLTNFVAVMKMRQCQLDIPMALFTFGALWSWWRALMCLETGRPRFGRAVFWGGLWLAVAHMYKFPVPYLFLLSAWGGAIAARRRWRWLLRWEWWAALVGSLIPLVLWGLLAGSAVGWDRASKIWLREGLLHTGGATEMNSGPLWFYVPRVVACFLPWSLLIPVLFLRRFWEAQRGRWLTFQYVGIGTAVGLAALSLNPSKETEYMLALVPFMGILLAWAWEYWVTEGRGKTWPVRARHWVIGGAIGAWFVAVWGGLTLQDLYMSHRRSVREPAHLAREAIDAGRPVVILEGLNRPQLYYYIRRKVVVLPSSAMIASFLDKYPDTWVMLSARKRGKLQALRPLRVVATGGPSADLEIVELATTPTLSGNAHPKRK